MTSPSLDFLTRLKNGYIASKKTVTAPASKLIIALADILKKNSFIEGYSLSDLPNGGRIISVNLRYNQKQPAISHVKIYSKPGRRIYCDSTNIPWGVDSNSLVIISSSIGLINQKQAQKRKIGGELIAQIS